MHNKKILSDSFRLSGRIFYDFLAEILRVGFGQFFSLCAVACQMAGHQHLCHFCIMALECIKNILMVGNHIVEVSLFRRECAKPVEMDHLLSNDMVRPHFVDRLENQLVELVIKLKHPVIVFCLGALALKLDVLLEGI